MVFEFPLRGTGGGWLAFDGTVFYFLNTLFSARWFGLIGLLPVIILPEFFEKENPKRLFG